MQKSARVAAPTWLRHSVLMAAIVSWHGAAHASCERSWTPGNFKLTETYPLSCPPADQDFVFAGNGVYESRIYGAGRYVVNHPLPANAAYRRVTLLDNHARLEFEGFDVVLGDASGGQSFYNSSEWHITDGHGLRSAGPNISFYNNGLFVKSGGGTSLLNLPFVNAGKLEIAAGELHFARDFQSQLRASVRIAKGSKLSFGDGVFARVEKVLGGQLSLGSNATLLGNLSNGTLEGGANSRLQRGTWLHDMAVTGTIGVEQTNWVFTEGTITVDGRFQFFGGSADGGYTSELNVTKKTVLAGKGETVFGGNGHNIVFSSNQGHLTIAAGHTVRGSASFNIGDNGEAHVWRNEGTLRAEGELGIRIYSSKGGLENTGVIEIEDGSRLFVQQGQIRGGVIRGAGTASLVGDRFADLTLQGQLTLAGGRATHASGRIANQGLLTFFSSSDPGPRPMPAQLVISGATTLDGAGLTRMAPGAAIASYDGSGTFTLGREQRLVGIGAIGLPGSEPNLQSFTVQGILLTAAEQVLSVAVPNAMFVNEGLVDVVAQSYLLSKGSFVQRGEHASLHVDGYLNAPHLVITGGTVSGVGVIKGNVELQGGKLSPGNSPGTLRIDGNLLMGTDALLAIELGLSDQDLLVVTGRAELSGKLLLSLATGAKLGDSFEILSASHGFTGSFTQVSAQGFQLSEDYSGDAIRITVTGISPVPEPAIHLLFAAGLLTLAALRRQPSLRL